MKTQLRHARITLAVFLSVILILPSISLIPGTQEALASASSNPVVVSMGDSYSSGEGNEPFYDQNNPNKYDLPNWIGHRSEKSWPGRLVINGKTMNTQMDNGWYFVASSGAETKDISGKQEIKWTDSDDKEHSRYQAPQIDVFNNLNNGSVDYVTLTIGGNDVGFADVVEAACYDVGYLQFGNLYKRLYEGIEKFDSETCTNLATVYNDIEKKAGNQATTLVAGYPHLFSTTKPNYSGVAKIGSVVIVDDIGLLISNDEAKDLNDAVDVVNLGIEQIIKGINRDNLVYVDVQRYFNGDPTEYIYPVYTFPMDQDLGTGPSHYSVHPNEKGLQAYAKAVQDAIDRIESTKVEKAAAVVAAQEAAVAAPATDISMSLVYDVSGSMSDSSAVTGKTKLESAIHQGVSFVSSVKPIGAGAGGASVKIGVVSFSDYGQVNCDLSTDQDAVTSSINSLETHNMTNMYEGLDLGIKQLQDAEDDAKILVFLSDGMNNSGYSNTEVKSLADLANNLGIKIYSIGYGATSDLDEDILRYMADVTGGSYTHEDAANISEAAVGIFQTMKRAELQASGQSILAEDVNRVSQGQTKQISSAQVDTNGTLTTYLYWPGSLLTMEIKDPSGKVVDETYKGYTIDNSSIPTKIEITNAAEGTWEMSVTGEEVSMDSEPFYAVTAFKETEAPKVASTAGGGGVADSGAGFLFVFIVIIVGSFLGLYAFTKRRSANKGR